MLLFTLAHGETEAQRGTNAWQACLAPRLSLDGRLPPSWMVVTGPEPGPPCSWSVTPRWGSGWAIQDACQDSPSDSEAALKIR